MGTCRSVIYMINVKEGRFFYKLTTEKIPEYKNELLKFLSAKAVQENELQKVGEIDFNSVIETTVNIKHSRFDLNVKVAEEEVILLFGCQMDTDEFNDMVTGYFG